MIFHSCLHCEREEIVLFEIVSLRGQQGWHLSLVPLFHRSHLRAQLKTDKSAEVVV